MTRLAVLLVLSLLIADSSSMFGKIYVQRISSLQDLARASANLNYLTMFFFYRETPQAAEILPAVVRFAEKTKDFYRVLSVDCALIHQKEDAIVAEACHERLKDQLPKILFMEPQAERIDPRTGREVEPLQHQYEGSVTFEALDDFAKKVMPNFSKRLVIVEDHENFLAKEPNLNKAVLLIDKKTVPQYWKALASKFRDRLIVRHISAI